MSDDEFGFGDDDFDDSFLQQVDDIAAKASTTTTAVTSKSSRIGFQNASKLTRESSNITRHMAVAEVFHRLRYCTVCDVDWCQACETRRVNLHMITTSPSCQFIWVTMLLTPCVAFGTMTTSSWRAPIKPATFDRTSLSLGNQLRRMKMSGNDSTSSESLRMASITGMGGEP